MPSDAPRHRRFIKAVLPVTFLLVTGIFALVSQTKLSQPKSSDADLEDAANYVAKNFGEADAVRVFPTWDPRALISLQGVREQVLPQDAPVMGDVHRFDTIWVISEVGRTEEALLSLPFEVGTADRSRRFGGVDVVQVKTPERPKYRHELLAHLEDARVTRVKGDDIISCSNWNAKRRRWDCARRQDPWVYVGESIRELDDDPRRCIWAHPPPNGYWVSIQFPQVTLGDRFRLRAGPTANAWRSDRGPAIHIELEIDAEKTQHTFAPRTQAWTAIDLDTSSKRGEEHSVTVRVRADQLWERFFCFNGWAIDD